MTKPQIALTLTTSDAKVLDAVFDPESAPEAPRITVDPSLPSDPHIRDAQLLARLREQEIAAVKIIEACPSQDGDAKRETYRKALEILDAVIEEQPMYASAWNNRAQIRRWMYGDRGTLTTASIPASEEALEIRATLVQALKELDTAIALASPASREPAVSPSQKKLLAQAWTQRAAIFWGVAKDLGSSERSVIVVPDEAEQPTWSKWTRVDFEEEGSRCFFMAGLYGSEVGRAMAVLSNPTAKLCGSIVKEAMKRERCGS
ncbi:uncharacterized protein PV09_03110 [Verruconis gallopava]|uniref:Uncharacterized protein n=1 Tax=Verruconis gallopava TaxID=253628 RepID=A0A0D1YZ01_9PEZI|nr:uncharacterized protein PV09_03110 [Verruconis gallopava]KIW05917.1 hypothetical protein PV09_03110 [Verruconis gallopava]